MAILNQNTRRSRFIVTLRKIRALSCTTPELDELDAWLATRRLYFAGVILAAPIVLIILALRPLVVLRFGVFQGDRIGALALSAKGCLLNYKRPKTWWRMYDFLGMTGPVSNLQLARMLARQAPLLAGAWLWQFVDRACQFWTRGSVHHVAMYGSMNHWPQFQTSAVMLHFTYSETEEGEKLLGLLGIPPNTPWVCIHNRDPKYLDTYLSSVKLAPGKSWSYHNYRDFNVKSLLLAAEDLASRGYYVVRMGASVEEPLVSNSPRIIDYACTPYRGDLADIYLLSHCAAYLGSDSGIFTVPLVFGKPTFLVNFPLAYCPQMTYTTSDPFIPKHLWHRETQRFLALREVFEKELLFAGDSQLYEEAGVDVVSNTAEEIRDLATELDERLNGTWQSQVQDERLQKLFWESFRQYCPSEMMGGVPARIGSSFLRQHRYLLD